MLPGAEHRALLPLPASDILVRSENDLVRFRFGRVIQTS
jgi:hypothetical protein